MASRPVKQKKPQAARATIVVWTSLLRTVHKKVAQEAKKNGKSIALVLREKLEMIYAA